VGHRDFGNLITDCTSAGNSVSRVLGLNPLKLWFANGGALGSPGGSSALTAAAPQKFLTHGAGWGLKLSVSELLSGSGTTLWGHIVEAGAKVLRVFAWQGCRPSWPTGLWPPPPRLVSVGFPLFDLLYRGAYLKLCFLLGSLTPDAQTCSVFQSAMVL
jgi:hypothetical protein